MNKGFSHEPLLRIIIDPPLLPAPAPAVHTPTPDSLVLLALDLSIKKNAEPMPYKT